jgi:hypothetical protein
MFECYKGQVVHFMGGLHDFVGEIETFFQETDLPGMSTAPGVHPIGEGWIRINKPCLTSTIKDKGRQLEQIGTMGGPGHNYQDFVDIYIPPGQSVMEVRVVDPESDMFRAYQRVVSQIKPKHIVLPGSVPPIPDLPNLRQ